MQRLNLSILVPWKSFVKYDINIQTQHKKQGINQNNTIKMIQMTIFKKEKHLFEQKFNILETEKK